jgi:hypothetical protein
MGLTSSMFLLMTWRASTNGATAAEGKFLSFAESFTMPRGMRCPNMKSIMIVEII